MVANYKDFNVDEFYGYEETAGDADLLVAGTTLKYAPTMFFTGLKNPILVDGKVKGKAKGFAWEASKLDEKLVKIFKQLVTTKKATSIKVRHSDGTVKDYYQLVANPRFFLLTHGIPSAGVMKNDPTKRYGWAAGTTTTVNQKKGEQNTSTFAGCLAVERTLYEAGYVDDEGLPIPVQLRYKGLAGKEFTKALTIHFKFIKHLRDELGFSPRIAHFWAHAAELSVSEEEQTHYKSGGDDTESNDVFVIENTMPDDKSAWTEDVAASLFCGPELFKALFKLVYDTSVRPVAPGGIAMEWSIEQIENGYENQRKYNPKGDLPFGTKPAPAWLLMADRIKDASTFSQDTVYGDSQDSGNGHSNGATPAKLDPHAQLKADYTEPVNRLMRYFRSMDDAEGVKIMQPALAVLNDDTNFLPIDEAESTVDVAMKKGGERKKVLQAAAANDL